MAAVVTESDSGLVIPSSERILSPGKARVDITSYATRAEWLEARLTGIGSSEAAAVLGVSPWKSRYQLWAEKRRLVARPEGPASNAAHWGLRLEAIVAEEYANVTGRRLLNLGSYTVSRPVDRPFMFATHDRVIEAFDDRGPGILSIKTADKTKAEQWGGVTSAPLDYQVQLQHELSISGYRWGSFAVLIGGNDFRWIDVERNDSFIEQLESECFQFWCEVESGAAPPVDASESTSETIKRMYPQDDGTTVYLPGDALQWDREREEAAELIRQGESRKRAVDNKIMAAIGTATFGLLPNGARYSFKPKTRGAYSVAAKTWRELRRHEAKENA